MKLSYKEIESLSNQFGTSFYVFDVHKLRDNYRKLHTAFQSRYPNLIIGYSYKTNYVPYLCKEMDSLGAYAEVVSKLEYDLAVKIGVDPKKIIFNGPIKSCEDIKEALDNESLLNIDSLYEMDHVISYCIDNPDRHIKIGVRLNFDISRSGNNVLQEGYEKSRFGICVANGDFEHVLRKFAEIENIIVSGLHAHFSTKERKVESYCSITEELCRIAKKYRLDTIEYIDIGGGFYGELPPAFAAQAPSFDDYASAICGVLNREFPYENRKPYLILEPGISLVANVFTFITKVVETKSIDDQFFVVVDGSVHNIKPTMHKRNLPMHFFYSREEIQEICHFHLVGYTCMEKDYLAFDVEGKLPAKNDYISFENVGAYTIVFNPPFIKERPAIVAFDHNSYIQIRKKETLKEFLHEDLYLFS
ncbi:diaminopimelate decarboxylase [Bacillus sp. FJAT-49736]|uniref:diaminopimelate decarboxylase n=1 Tax=Bacillus sp. FJAT-49736 TaxID=2833582 RepID=UPI001BC9F79F|nr:diaminopimelate decarboxylase [Bacillus sp. FJAT-49736]MBS4172945.1 diaminopimelate decarboxylase [Bacillus sp. FJAT-49736]